MNYRSFLFVICGFRTLTGFLTKSTLLFFIPDRDTLYFPRKLSLAFERKSYAHASIFFFFLRGDNHGEQIRQNIKRGNMSTKNDRK